MALVSELGGDGIVEGEQEQLEAIARKLAQPRISPIKFLQPCEATQGHRFSDELRSYIGLFERFELEVCDPADAELRMPPVSGSLSQLLELSGPSWIADFVGFLCAASVVVQQDEMSYLAAWHGTSSGRSKIFYFHPNDWGLWPTEGSILARMVKLLQEEERELYEEDASLEAMLLLLERAARSELLPPHLDPAELFGRVDWLVHALLGVGRDYEQELARALTIDRWPKERDHAKRYPHLATYWLFSHLLLENREELEDLLEVTADLTNGVFAEARSFAVAVLDDRPVRIGDHTQESFAELIEEIGAAAPVELLGPSSLRIKKRRREEEGDGASAQQALEALIVASEEAPEVRRALDLLKHLERGGANRPEPTERVPLDVDEAMAALADAVDARFKPIILERLERAALFSDTHRQASWGLLLAWAALAEDLTTFEALLERIGTRNFGPRRMTELYRAYARFDDPRATEILALGARSWLADVDDWLRMTPPEPVFRLMERDVLQTHEIMAKILETASFTGANWDVCVEVAKAAGELSSKRAVKGLKRAVDKQLGRIEDGSRAAVARALYLAGKGKVRPFLEEQVQKRMAELRYAPEAESGLVRRNLACLLSALIPAAHDDEHVMKKAAEIVQELVEAIETQGPRRSTVASLEAVLQGVRLGEARALTDTVSAVAALEASGPRLKGLVTLAQDILQELRA